MGFQFPEKGQEKEKTCLLAGEGVPNWQSAV